MQVTQNGAFVSISFARAAQGSLAATALLLPGTARALVCGLGKHMNSEGQCVANAVPSRSQLKSLDAIHLKPLQPPPAREQPRLIVPPGSSGRLKPSGTAPLARGTHAIELKQCSNGKYLADGQCVCPPGFHDHFGYCMPNCQPVMACP